jgi:hypothetical protein
MSYFLFTAKFQNLARIIIRNLKLGFYFKQTQILLIKMVSNH